MEQHNKITNIVKFIEIIESNNFLKFLDLSSKYNKDCSLMYIGFKVIKDDNKSHNMSVNNLNITITYKKYTELNPLSANLNFSILLNENYPSVIPTVKCLTDFYFPSLSDNRNLLYSIINHNWVDDSKLEEIIEKIPVFVYRVIENTNNKVLVYYGDYYIDKIYDMNDFNITQNIDFYRVRDSVFKKGKTTEKNRYIILSDIYFLLFDPVPSAKNLGKLVFWGDIRQIMSCKGNSNNAESILLEWKGEGNQTLISFNLTFLGTGNQLADFIEKSAKKILRLKDHFKIYQDDMNKPNQETKLNVNNLDKLILLIKYKEDLYSSRQSINIIKELMALYQKVIEIMSAKNDPDFKIYLDKLHVMLENKEIQEQLNKDNEDSNTRISKLLEMGSFYDGSNCDEEFAD
jgi:ubiquitin-protein ligase